VPVFEARSEALYYRLRRAPQAAAAAWLDAIHAVGGLFNLALAAPGDYGSGRMTRVRVTASAPEGLSDTARVWRGTCAEVAEHVRPYAEGVER
jgi:hypothetical protein